MKRTPSKRKSHIERIQEENKELLKSMGIEELASSESRSTRRSTRSNTKAPAQAPVTPPTPKRQPATPTSSRRGKKKIDEDENLEAKGELTLAVEKTEEPLADGISSPIEPIPPLKRQKLSETATDEIPTKEQTTLTAVEEKKKDESIIVSAVADAREEGITEPQKNKDDIKKDEVDIDSGKECVTSAEEFEENITQVKEIALAISCEPMPDIESAKTEKECLEQQISSSSEKIAETLLDVAENPERIAVVTGVVKESTILLEPVVEAVKTENEPMQVFEISSENKSQVVAADKELTLENIEEQSKIEATQGELPLNR